jgi:hypothetical protein
MSHKDSIFIKKCRDQLEKRLNWLDRNNLKQSGYQYLGDLVFEKNYEEAEKNATVPQKIKNSNFEPGLVCQNCFIFI